MGKKIRNSDQKKNKKKNGREPHRKGVEAVWEGLEVQLRVTYWTPPAGGSPEKCPFLFSQSFLRLLVKYRTVQRENKNDL